MFCIFTFLFIAFSAARISLNPKGIVYFPYTQIISY